MTLEAWRAEKIVWHASPPHDRDRRRCRRCDGRDVGRDVASRFIRLAGTKAGRFVRASLSRSTASAFRNDARAIDKRCPGRRLVSAPRWPRRLGVVTAVGIAPFGFSEGVTRFSIRDVKWCAERVRRSGGAFTTPRTKWCTSSDVKSADERAAAPAFGNDTACPAVADSRQCGRAEQRRDDEERHSCTGPQTH